MASAPKYKLKVMGDAKSVAIPKFAEITVDHMSGPNAQLFVDAVKKLDAKNKTNFFEKYFEEVK